MDVKKDSRKAILFCIIRNMNFYRVNDEYVEFLWNIDKKVYYNKSEEHQRPYIGVVLEVNNHLYLAPLTSYKSKQDDFKSSDPRFYKIHEKGNALNKLGVIALNNMVPVHDGVIWKIDFSSQEIPYQRMLKLQRAFITPHGEEIKSRAAKLYRLIVEKKHEYYSQTCCDFSLLESKYKEWQCAVPVNLPAQEVAGEPSVKGPETTEKA